MGFNNQESRRIVLDIETVALPDAAGFIETPRAPKNWKDPAKIAAYVAEKQNEETAEAGLDHDLAQIVAIGILYEGEDEPLVTTINDMHEAEMLRWYWHHVGQRATVGYNTLGFDLPMVLRRSLYLGVTTPVINLDRYRTPHIDLQQKLSYDGKFKYRSLNWYCKRFALNVADDSVTGEDIPRLVVEGNWAAIADHCWTDVLKVAELAKRMGYIQVPKVAEEAVL